jgi:CubicO group peptidase (beta-lactamase class C family)
VSTLGELCDLARRDVENGWLPACQLAVARDGEVVEFATFGAATDTTRFCIFSATKPIVASAVWMLMAEGRIDVADRVARVVPEFGTNGKGLVTIEQVMLHTSGFPNAHLVADGADRERRRAAFADWQLEWEPGTRFEYHGASAHWVLAELIERVTGLDYRDFVDARITTPLGIPRALGVPLDAQAVCADVVAAGAVPELGPHEATVNTVEFRAAGVPGSGAFMTAAELARFYQALLHDRAGLWDPVILADAKTNVRCDFDDPLMGVPAGRTLGLVRAGDDGKHILRYAIFGAHCSPDAFGHAGAHAQVGWADPASGISFAYLTNGMDSEMMREGIRSNALATVASALES